MAKECRHFARGFCQMGDACGFLHEASGTSAPQQATGVSPGGQKLCRHFARGYCQMGSSCGFFHDDSAAPSPAPHHPMQHHSVPQHSSSAAKRLAPDDWNSEIQPKASRADDHYLAMDEWNSGGQPKASAPRADGQHYLKTALCRHFSSNANGCSMGNRCSFAHGEHELGTSQPPGNPGQNASGNMSLPSGQPPRQQIKYQMCRHFARGGCQLGDSCGFAHGESQVGQLSDQGQPHRKSKLCENFQRGHCVWETTCQFAHGEAEIGATQPTAQQIKDVKTAYSYKSKLCFHFARGQCVTGDGCQFAHGEADLQQVGIHGAAESYAYAGH